MRLNKRYIIVLLLISGCRGKNNFQDNTLVVQAFIESKINQRSFDIRIFDPPPPELQGSIGHQGQVRSDSIIKKLSPLQVYINSSIVYDSNFNPNQDTTKDFYLENSKPVNGGRDLNIEGLKKKRGVILNSTTAEKFFEVYPSINLKEGYGGFVSFKNLYYSEDGKKAVFQFTYYRRKLNSSTSIVYAEKQNDGSWEFILEIVSTS